MRTWQTTKGAKRARAVSVGACSLVGLLLELGGAVRESNIEFFGSLHDGLPKEREETGQRIE